MATEVKPVARGFSAETAFGVSEITAAIKNVLKPFTKIFVEGEVSGLTVSSAGHAYFMLKDDAAQISCVMFSNSLNVCKARSRLQNGVKLCAYGRIDVYEARGNYQLIVLAAKVAGEGELMARYLALKEQLAKEGLFTSSRKRKLPFLPHRIGIVTSPTGAVIHDMCNVLTRRFPGIGITLFPSKIQGEGAKEDIVNGIKWFNALENPPDLLIVGRGGGSLEDLWAFNEECVVRAVAASKIPVISAVGHETDFTLCDFAADRRAGTPSIAAEVAVPERAQLEQRVGELRDRMVRALEHRSEVYAQKTDSLSMRLDAALGNAAARYERRLETLAQRLNPAMRLAIAAAERRLSVVLGKLSVLDPSNTLKRGYSLTFTSGGKLIRSVADAEAGSSLVTRLADGEIKSTVSP